ncbi:cryptochrome/photolyase family protein [Eionea flava]
MNIPSSVNCLRLILGDQLSHNISSLRECDKARDIIFMCEVYEEATYVKHHKKKIAYLFSAMRHFAKALKNQGYAVIYVTIDDERNQGSFFSEVARAVKQFSPSSIEVTYPGEYRVLKMLQSWEQQLSLPVNILEDTRFLTQPQDFAQWAHGRKQLRMEYFYREVRKRYDILMNAKKPEGGAWNYDADNRKALPKHIEPPQPTKFPPDNITKDVMMLVEEKFPEHFGDLSSFHYAVNREQALQVLDDFITERLLNFGDYQDAMKQDSPWLYHSHISFYLNSGLLEPLEVVQRVEREYHAGNAPLSSVEGFIRQVIGWREYVRGLYWYKMPDYAEMNYLNASNSLPELYWGADTKMNCLKQCVDDTYKNSYAHHIQRLMVLGNFALLTDVDPGQVNEWYLLVYADAYEWVEMPNVTGMILFADGGIMASKPYISSGAYINKMSNYCQHCEYSVKEKNGDGACPFNYLYWDFLRRHKEQLLSNPRLGMPYRTLSKMTDEKVELIASDAERFMTALMD